MMKFGQFLPRSSASLILLAAASTMMAEQPTVKAEIRAFRDRKPAPGFRLVDAAGKQTRLADYRGKVVLLDFWATWCHGCKEEIPWFAEFERAYKRKGFAVVGVSLDEGGWPPVKKFLESADVPYRMLLGDDALAKQYAIENMPDAFLIDRKGRVAAVYVGLVDRVDVESNIQKILNERDRNK